MLKVCKPIAYGECLKSVACAFFQCSDALSVAWSEGFDCRPEPIDSIPDRHANTGGFELVSRCFLSSVLTVACNSNLPRCEQKWQVLVFVHDTCDRALWT
jgi:hypothetical protein